MSIPINKLSEPFPTESIKQRKGPNGKIDYIESSTVIQRLNEALEGQWSFSILGYKIGEEEVIVQGELSIYDIKHQQFGGSQITRKTDTKEIVSIADDLKASAADCLKKCASYFGVGLNLYTNENGNGLVKRILNAGVKAGWTQVQVIEACKQAYGVPIGKLSKSQADEFISTIKPERSVNRAQNKSTC